MTTLYLFSHQDDEIGVFHDLAEVKRAGKPVACVFLTNGVWGGITSDARNAESQKTLQALGVCPSEIDQLGTRIAIPDGRLVENLEPCFDALCTIVDQHERLGRPVNRIITHAWEGGHHDHDAAHILGVALAHRYGLLSTSWQYALYRRSSKPKRIGFALPLAANGAVSESRIPIARRLYHLRLLANYKSQARVILRLLPHIVRDYVLTGTQRMQPLSVKRVHEDPNVPPMLYEGWKLYTYDRFRTHALPFIERHVPDTLTSQPGASK